MLGLHELDAWAHLRNWRRTDLGPAVRVASTGMTTVTDPAVAWDVLRGSPDFRRDSGFFMVSRTGTLDRQSLDHMSTNTKKLLRVRRADISSAVSELLQSQTFKTQEAGARFALRAFSAHLGLGRSPLLKGAATAYLERVIIPFSIQGRWPATHREHFRRAAGLATAYFADSEVHSPGPSEQPLDVPAIISELPASISAEDRGELYLRQVLAFVGFTGVAFEWLIYLVAAEDEWQGRVPSRNEAIQFVNEAQRMYPTAWRLVRTASKDVSVAGMRLTTGSDLLIPTYLFHHDTRWWNRPEQFDLARWGPSPPPRGAYLPFGAGNGVCPASSLMPGFLAESLIRVLMEVQPRVRRRRSPTPRALSLLAPPRVRVSLRPRSDEGRDRDQATRL